VRDRSGDLSEELDPEDMPLMEVIRLSEIEA
jgi:hypothetical protein